MRNLIVLLFALFWVYSLFAIEPEPSALDTIHLDEITTYADHIKYQPGSKIVSFSSEMLRSSGTAGIDQLISRHTPIYIKSDAGGISTIRVRGTSPDHTTINFGGINLNSLTLGHSNMSQIPIFLFDRIDLQYGGSSALNGSGAIGGAIYLGNTNQWTKGVKAEITTNRGAFGEQLYGTKVFIGNGRFESVSRIYSYRKENNFPFLNKYTGNIENREPINDVQHGAAVKNSGLMQEVNYLFSDSDFLKSSIWFDKSWYQIQPNMQSNINFKQTEEMINQNIRFWSEYKNEKQALKYSIGAGYVHDYQMFNHNSNQEIITDRAISEGSVKRALKKNLEFRLGAKYQYIVPSVYSYSSTNITSEQHFDVYLSGFYQPFTRLKTTLNLRQMLVTNYKAPFTPALGAEYILSTGLFHLLKMKGNISRSYRIPTFNDRYWGLQGNPGLKPEDGLNLETGIEYHYCNGGTFLSFTVNGYYMDVDNWIEWRNFGVWKAANVQRVISKGLETTVLFHFETGQVKSEIAANYSMNKAEKNETKPDGTIFIHQMIYSPIHSGNVSYQLSLQKLRFYVDGRFTGNRFTNYLGSKIPSFFLTNTGASYQLVVKGQECRLSLAANNIFNVSYENEKYYAMPGINFRAGLTLIIKS